MLLLLLACASDPADTGGDDTAVGHDTAEGDADTDTDTDTDTDSGETGDTDSGETGDTDTGETGDTDTGETGDTDTGETGDTDTGETGDTDTAPEVVGGAYDAEADAYTTWTGGGSQWLGYALAPTGDIDGDGVVDLLVVSSYGSSSSGGGGSGRTPAVTLIYGLSFGPGSYAATVPPEQEPDYAKYDWDLGGDFDGDGYNEVAWVGTDPAGRTSVELLWGDGTRWTDGGSVRADVTIEADSSWGLGSEIAVGDADGDGFSDVLSARTGGAALIYGDATRLTDGDTADHVEIAGSSAWFGGGDVAIGDLDGDGLGDLAITDVYDGMAGADAPGAVYVLYSDGRFASSLALPGDEDAVIRAPTGMGLVYMGYQLEVGDLDGDGYGELVAATHNYDSAHGIAWVFEGTTRWSGEYATTDAKGYIYGATASPFAVSVELTDDIDGDKAKDLFVGATNAGVFLFRGADVSGALTDADAFISITGGPADGKLGYTVSSGDLDDDGVTDLVAGAYGAYGTGSGDGRVWFYSGAGL